ncbi:amidase domain-containing protein [Brevibacillus marinus]|uniref:amidase domain-containing protein n=1 Tax=Brevibacillus marinus TaxID=2496837 RepID=UPI000F8171CC|nr:amidase domain-containing protein [Brevibacillus marinus]
MDKTWIDQLKAYLQDVNRTCVDGQSGRLQRYFSRQLAQESVPERQGQQLQGLQRAPEPGERPRAARLQVRPLIMSTIGERQAEAVIALHQRVYAAEGEAACARERQWVERVKLERGEDDRWLLGEPWDSFFTWPVPADSPASDLREEEPAARTAAVRGGYDRERAVAYAETYWNSANPAYRQFAVDCTNFVSQCLHAGGIPMLFSQSRSTGWWYRGGQRADWSYSWAVAHSLYLLLRSGKAPFYARQVADPSQLAIGDVICYDFDGDGRWQHNTIVVAKDGQNMPLVNAHTTNSRHRYWEYRDSTAYTPNIRYGFFRILPEEATNE